MMGTNPLKRQYLAFVKTKTSPTCALTPSGQLDDFHQLPRCLIRRKEFLVSAYEWDFVAVLPEA